MECLQGGKQFRTYLIIFRWSQHAVSLFSDNSLTKESTVSVQPCLQGCFHHFNYFKRKQLWVLDLCLVQILERLKQYTLKPGSRCFCLTPITLPVSYIWLKLKLPHFGQTKAVFQKRLFLMLFISTDTVYLSLCNPSLRLCQKMPKEE